MPKGNCPVCLDQPLVPDAEDPLIRHCPRCGGSLLDSVGVPEDFRTAGAEGVSVAVADSLVCPRCESTMNPVTMPDLACYLCVGCGDAWMKAVAHPAAAETPEKSAARLSSFLLYAVTLPERALRSTVGLTAGAARETAQFLVPQAFQTSKTYEVIVRNSLRFLCEDVGGVAKKPDDVVLGKDFVARKAVGNFIDLAGLATMAVSPVWLMAIVSDVAYGSKTYVKELAEELRQKGLIDETSTIHNVDDLLASVKDATGKTATMVDTPPLSVAELKQSLAETRKALGSVDVRSVLPEAELKRYWQEMREISQRENVSLLGVSGALTMHALGKVGTVTRGTFAGVKVAGGLFNRHVIGHYVEALNDVRQRGFYQSVRESSAPYVEAVWNNFRVERSTWTEELLSGRAVGKAWKSFRGWFSKPKPAGDAAAPAPGEPSPPAT